MGSSFAAGPGIDPIVDAPAGRSGRNYAHLVAERLELRLTDLSYSGATSRDLLRPGRSVRSRLLGPLGRARLGPQLEGVPADAELITLTVGGNDLGYVSGLIKASLVNSGPGRLPVIGAALSRRTRIGADAEAIRGLAQSLTTVITAARGRAPDARILLVDYLSLVGDGDDPAGLPLTAAQLGQAQALGRALTAVFREIAEGTGVELVEAAKAGADHHAGSADPWVTGWLGPRGVSYHPNAAGMAAVAELIIDKLTDTAGSQ